MITRRLIRDKVLQILYAYKQNDDKGVEALKSELTFSLSKAYDLYNYLLYLPVAVTDYADRRIDMARHKLMPTSDELNPNMKFVQNLFVAQLRENRMLVDYLQKQKRTWPDEVLKGLYEAIQETTAYEAYMAKDGQDYASDKELWKRLYRQLVVDNDALDAYLEDVSLYWNDDKEVVDTFVIKTFGLFDEADGPDKALLPQYGSEEESDFAMQLLENTLAHAEENKAFIAEHTRNWDVNRVTQTDYVILHMALTELLTFPNIPVSVVLNEYIDLAKKYGTPKSGAFVNGSLDGFVKVLRQNGSLFKKE